MEINNKKCKVCGRNHQSHGRWWAVIPWNVECNACKGGFYSAEKSLCKKCLGTCIASIPYRDIILN